MPRVREFEAAIMGNVVSVSVWKPNCDDKVEGSGEDVSSGKRAKVR